MKKILSVLLCAVLFLAGQGIISLCAQESETDVDIVVPETDVQWTWGEVVSVDAAARQITLKYLDYETDVEAQISMNTDENTGFENVASLAEIKPGDTVSVDYSVDLEGRNIAKNISVEKDEGMQAMPGEETQE